MTPEEIGKRLIGIESNEIDFTALNNFCHYVKRNKREAERREKIIKNIKLSEESSKNSGNETARENNPSWKRT